MTGWSARGDAPLGRFERWLSELLIEQLMGR